MYVRSFNNVGKNLRASKADFTFREVVYGRNAIRAPIDGLVELASDHSDVDRFGARS